MKPDDKAEPVKPSAPDVPKELMSARPALSKVVPRSPDKLAEASQATDDPAPTEQDISDRKERVDYLRNIRDSEKSAKKPSRAGKKWLVAVIIIVLILAASAAAYWFLKPSKSKPAAKTTAAQSQTTPSTTGASSVDMKAYSSTNFALSLKYPATWTVSDTTSALTITSPIQSLEAASGGSQTGSIVLTIQNQQASLPQFKSGNASAVLESEKINYAEPASGQRASTYISFLQYAATTTKGALDAIYITGNAGYQKGQYVPQTDITKVDPLIVVSFLQCSSTCAPGAPALSVSSDMWTGSFKSTLETVFKSLQIN